MSTTVFRLPSGVLFIAAQFAPMGLLALAYLATQDEITLVYVGGVSLDLLLLTSAVIAPLLSQSVSGPLFRSLEQLPEREFAQTAEIALRHLPRAMAVAAPGLLLMCGGAAWAMGLDLRAGVALAAVAWVHLLFAGALVPAYAHRRGALLMVGWSTYAALLGAAPEVWWAPAVAGAASQLVPLLWSSRSFVGPVPRAGVGAMVAGLARGTALALPLWCLPAAVYLGSRGAVSPYGIFLALAPAVLAYQVYFVLVATPAWTRLDRARELLAHEPYATARAELASIGHQVRSGLRRTTGLVGALLLGISALIALGAVTDAEIYLGVAASAGLSVILIAQVTRFVMLREGVAPYAAAAIVGLAALGGAEAGPAGILVLHGLACLVCLATALAANRVAWRTPEYALFWARALHA
jgi:hypothetical protein